MKKLTSLLAGLALVSTALSVSAMTPQEQAIVDSLKQQFDWKVEQIEPSPVKGLWQVWVQNRLFYVDEGAKHLVAGPVVETATRRDLSEAKEGEWRWASFPRKDAIKQVYGNGSRELVVFSDANCTFCAQMEREFEKAGNLTVYTFVMPMLRGRENGREIVCATDPAKAWHDWMVGRAALPTPPASCDDSVLDRNLALAGELGINSAPTMYFKSGQTVRGAIPLEALERHLQAK